MEESQTCLYSPPTMEVEFDICLSVFLMPPIPTVLRCSFLFL
ncbi:uncharacterized protein LOC112899140 [Panicum hallii]|nr:uncharacterized protein LOC112899140 [Panicum hallii]